MSAGSHVRRDAAREEIHVQTISSDLTLSVLRQPGHAPQGARVRCRQPHHRRRRDEFCPIITLPISY